LINSTRWGKKEITEKIAADLCRYGQVFETQGTYLYLSDGLCFSGCGRDPRFGQ
jgi:hypothetical protein